MDSMGGMLTNGLSGGPACRTLILGWSRLFVAVELVKSGSLGGGGGGFPIAPGESLNVFVPKGQQSYSVKIKVKAFGQELNSSLVLKKHAYNAIASVVNTPKHIKHIWSVVVDSIREAIPMVSLVNLKEAIPSVIASTIRRAKPLAKIFNLRRHDK